MGRAISDRRNVRGEDGIGRIERKANRVGEMRTFGRVGRERGKGGGGEPYRAEEMFWGRMAWGILRTGRTFERIKECGRIWEWGGPCRAEEGMFGGKVERSVLREGRTFERIKECGRIWEWGGSYQTEEGMFGEEWNGHMGGGWRGILRVGEYLDETEGTGIR